MTHSSPASFLVWAVLSSALFVFLIQHLWSFDRFRCLKWSSAKNGAFKRLMTYSYLLSIPMLLFFSLGMAIIKYHEGYIMIFGIFLPKPSQLWTPYHQTWVTPLYLMFATSWALEMVSHLEELNFWYFLLHQKAHGTSWFKSIYFYSWLFGGITALVTLPTVAIVYRKDPFQLEAMVLLTGSIGSLLITVAFLPVLYTFPKFIRKVKKESGDPSVVVRLSKFHSLNCMRVPCRFLFVGPLLTLAIDGVNPHHRHIAENFMATDILSMIAGLGCVASSAITLLIFFPRSYEKEAGYRYRERPMTYLSSPEETKASFEFSYDVAHTNRDSKFTEPQKEREAAFHFAQKQMMQFGYKPDGYARHLSLLPTVPYAPPIQSVVSNEMNDRDMAASISAPSVPPRPSQDTGEHYQNHQHSRKRSASKGVTAYNNQPKHTPLPSLDVVPTPWSHPFSSEETIRPYRPKSHSGPRRPVWELVNIDDEVPYAFRMETRPPPTADNGMVTIEEGLGRQLSVHPLALNFTSPLDLGNDL